MYTSPLLEPCSYEEVATIMFAHVAEAAKRAYKKISSHTVDTNVRVLAIPVVQ